MKWSLKVQQNILLSFVSEFSIKTELNPSYSPNKCPSDTFDGKSTCFCEDHCSWNVCRLGKPTNYCSTNLRNPWGWDSSRKHWVIQGI